jgi:hypothetical protein
MDLKKRILILVLSLTLLPSLPAHSEPSISGVIVEGSACDILDQVAPLSSTRMKVTCVEKDGKYFWSTNPQAYKKIAEQASSAPCDAECRSDRAGIAAAELEALEPSKNFPKWVLDAQSYFSKIVFDKARQAFGSGRYEFVNPMPLPAAGAETNPSVNSFGSYKWTLRIWSENEVISLNRSQHTSADSVESDKKTPEKLEVTKTSEGKYLVAIYSTIIDKPVTVTASKPTSKGIVIILNTDESGYASLLTSQKLAGYKILVSGNKKIKAITKIN